MQPGAVVTGVQAVAQAASLPRESRGRAHRDEAPVNGELRRKRLEIRRMIAELQTELEDGQDTHVAEHERSAKG